MRMSEYLMTPEGVPILVYEIETARKASDERQDEDGFTVGDRLAQVRGLLLEAQAKLGDGNKVAAALDRFAGAIWSEFSANSEVMPNVARHAGVLGDELAALGVALHPACVAALGVSAIVLGDKAGSESAGAPWSSIKLELVA